MLERSLHVACICLSLRTSPCQPWPTPAPLATLQVAAYVSIGFPLGLLSRMFLGSHSSWQVGCGRLVARGAGQAFGASTGLHTQPGKYASASAIFTLCMRTQALMRDGVEKRLPCLMIMGTSDQFTTLGTLQELVEKQQIDMLQVWVGRRAMGEIRKVEDHIPL